MSAHTDYCEAPICSADDNPNYKTDVLWYPGEGICGQSPIQKFQRMQRRINRKAAKGLFKHTDTFFTAASLAKLSRVNNGTKGKNPDKL